MKYKKILWMTWKDRKNPAAGGAEEVNEALARRLVANGNEVVMLVAGYSGATVKEVIDGYTVIRVGNRWTVYVAAYRYYQTHLRGWADLVIDEVNTIPFFAKFYVREKNILFIHMLCRKIWFYQITFPLSLIGYLLEPLYLRILNDRQVITVSESTKQELHTLGFKHIHLISEGITLKPVTSLSRINKCTRPTILALGAMRAMKQTGHILTAFEFAKKQIPDLQLIIAGDDSGRYGNTIRMRSKRSPFAKDIQFLGKVDARKKIALMQQAHLLCVTSVKEGWGLTVTEANSQGTPAVVYNTDGLRDSVKHDHTGIVCAQNQPKILASNIVDLLGDMDKYANLQKNAWAWSREITFDASYRDFIRL
jgi:glycosyltransferase involved in cell wall biosynthesis